MHGTSSAVVLTLFTRKSVCLQVAACWKDHCDQMLIIRSIFLYLDRTYVISTSGVRSLFEMGLQLFGGHLAEHPEVGVVLAPNSVKYMQSTCW